MLFIAEKAFILFRTVNTEDYVMAIKHPDEIAASGSEEAIQRALMQAVALWIIPKHPSATTLYHIPNGGARGKDARDAKIQGAKMQAAGQKKGIPDLCLPVPRQGYAALYIEMKKPKSGKLSPDQRRRIKELTSYGNFVIVVDTWLDGYYVMEAWYNWEQAVFRQTFAIFDCGQGLFIYDPKGFWS